MANHIETIKKGGLLVDLARYAREGYDSIPPDDHYRLKTLGICSQKGGAAFMLRIKIPHGLLDPAQLMRLSTLSREYAGGMAHLTTRQGMELHSITIQNVPTVLAQLEEVGLTTSAACGDTIRNVIGCPRAGVSQEELFDTRPWSQLIARHFIAMGPERLNIPRKVNPLVAGCRECAGQAQISDLGLVPTLGPLCADGTPELGFTLWVGGGLGANPRQACKVLDFVPFPDVIPAMETVLELYIANGIRRSRAEAKLKYLIESWGCDRFTAEFARAFAAKKAQDRANSRAPILPEPALPSPFQVLDDLPGDTRRQERVIARLQRKGLTVFAQKQRGYYGAVVRVPLGEITADQLLALAKLCQQHSHAQAAGTDQVAVLTREQNIELHWLPEAALVPVLVAVQKMGLAPAGATSLVDVQACPGTNFCPIAVSDTQAAGQALITMLEPRRERLGKAGIDLLRMHISGCPHSCALHQASSIGFAGTRVRPLRPGMSTYGYQIFLGGEMNERYEMGVLSHLGISEDALPQVVEQILDWYLQERLPEEGFPAYVQRLSHATLGDRIESAYHERWGA